MGRLNLLIEYRNGRKVYAPGDIVDAFVVLNLKKPRKIKKIKVKAVGQSQIKLNHEGKQLRNQEKYFSYLIDVYHGKKEDECSLNQHFMKIDTPCQFYFSLSRYIYHSPAPRHFPALPSFPLGLSRYI